MSWARGLATCLAVFGSWGCVVTFTGADSDDDEGIFFPADQTPGYSESWTKSAESPAPLLAIWGSSANDVWAVGSNNTVLHWNGASWSGTLSGTSGELRGVWGTGQSDIWAVGGTGGAMSQGQILHSDGATWTVSLRDSPCDFYAVWGSSTSDVWAVGSTNTTGCLYHWDGAAWKQQVPSAAAPLTAIWGSAANDVWAVGGTWSNGTIAHWDGAAWTTAVQGSEFVALYRLESVWGSGPSNVWAVGSQNVAHWDGQRWSVEQCTSDSNLLTTGSTPSTCPKSIHSVWGSSASDVWSMGAIVGYYGFAMHSNGTSWTFTDDDLDCAVYGVWGSGPNDVWAVGASGSTGAILHHEE